MGLSTLLKDYSTELLDYIRTGDLEGFRNIVERHVHTKARVAKLCQMDLRHRPSKRFACPLILAARQPDADCLQYMLACGASPNYVHRTVRAGDNAGSTGVGGGASRDAASSNADPSANKKKNQPTKHRGESLTPLQVAIDVSSYPCAELLLQRGADPNIADNKGDWPLLIAAANADCTLVRMLLAKGADPAKVDRHGRTAMHIASLYGHSQMAECLLKHDADVYQGTSHSTTSTPSHKGGRGGKGGGGDDGVLAPHLAAKADHVTLLHVFARHDAGCINVRAPCEKGGRDVTPLHLAAEQGNVSSVHALIGDLEADITITDGDGNTALHSCVLNRYSSLRMRDRDDFTASARNLLECGADPNARNSQRSETPLHLAARNNYPRIVELLLDYGANPLAESTTGAKPLDLLSSKDPVSKDLLKAAIAGTRRINDSTFNQGNRLASSSTTTLHHSHASPSTPASHRRHQGQDVNNQAPPLDHAPRRPEAAQHQTSLGQYEEAVTSTTTPVNDQYAKSRHQAQGDQFQVKGQVRGRSRSRARENQPNEQESARGGRARSNSSRRTLDSDRQTGVKEGRNPRERSRGRVNERDHEKSQVRLDRNASRDRSVGRNERGGELKNNERSPGKISKNDRGVPQQTRNRSSSRRRLPQDDLKPLKSPKPTREELERKVRKNKQKMNVEKLLNNEKERLRKKFSDGDSSSTRSENVHEMSSELREIFDQVGRTRAARLAEERGDSPAAKNKVNPAINSTPEEPIYGNVNTALAPYTGVEEVDRSYYYPPGAEDGSVDPYAYYPTEYTYDQMIQYAQAIGQQYLTQGGLGMPVAAPHAQRSDIDVHASRPGVLEVQYSGGPITIAVDTNAVPPSTSSSTRSALPPSGAPSSAMTSSRHREPTHHRSADQLASTENTEISRGEPLNKGTSLNHSFAARGAADRTFELDGQLGHLVQGQFHPYAASQSVSSPKHAKSDDITSQMRHDQQSPVLNFPMAADKTEPPDLPILDNPQLCSHPRQNQDRASHPRPAIFNEQREGTAADDDTFTPVASVRKSLSNRYIADLSTDHTDKSISSSVVSDSVSSFLDEDKASQDGGVEQSDEESEASQTSYQINMSSRSNEDLSSDDLSSELSMSSDSMDYDKYDEEDAQSYLSDLGDIPSDFPSEISSRSNEAAEKRIAEMLAERKKVNEDRDSERKERDRLDSQQRENERLEREELLRNERASAAERESKMDKEYRERIDDLTADFRAEIQRQRDEINRQRSLLDAGKLRAQQEILITSSDPTSSTVDHGSSDGSSLASPDLSPNGTPNGTPKQFVTRRHVFAPRVASRDQDCGESERPPDIDVDTQLNEIVAKLKQEEKEEEEGTQASEANKDADSDGDLSTDTLTDSETISVENVDNLSNSIQKAQDNIEITKIPDINTSVVTTKSESELIHSQPPNKEIDEQCDDKTGDVTESEMSDYLSVSEFREDDHSLTEGEDKMISCTEGEDQFTENEEIETLTESELNTCTESELNTSTDTRASDRGSSPTFSEGGSRYLTSQLSSNSALSSTASTTHSPGIGLRVTGTTPKAYKRSANESARRAFMLATPVGIESSDDSTIGGDLAGSRSSLSSLGGGYGHQKPPTPANKPKDNAASINDKKDDSLTDKEFKKQSISEVTRQFEEKAAGIIGVSLIAKPYQSFGTITNDTTEIDEVLATRSRDSSFGSLDDHNDKHKTQQTNQKTSEELPSAIVDEVNVKDANTDNKTDSLVIVESNVKVSDLKKKLKLVNSNINDIMKNKNPSTTSNRPIDLKLKDNEINMRNAKKMKSPIVLKSPSSKTNQNSFSNKIPSEVVSNNSIDEDNKNVIKDKINKENDQTNLELHTPMDPDLNTMNLQTNHSAPKAQRKAAKLAAKLDRKNKRKEKRERKEEKRSLKLKYEDHDEMSEDVNCLPIENSSIMNLSDNNENANDPSIKSDTMQFSEEVTIDKPVTLSDIGDVSENCTEERIYNPEKLSNIASVLLDNNGLKNEIISDTELLPDISVNDVVTSEPNTSDIDDIQENLLNVKQCIEHVDDDQISENNNISLEQETEKDIKKREKNARKNARKEKREKKEMRRIKKNSMSKEYILQNEDDKILNFDNIENQVDIQQNIYEQNTNNLINQEIIDNEPITTSIPLIDEHSDENEINQYSNQIKESVEKEIALESNNVQEINQYHELDKEKESQSNDVIEEKSAEPISEISNKMDKFPSPKDMKTLKKKAKEERKQSRLEKREMKQARKNKKSIDNLHEDLDDTVLNEKPTEREVIEIATFDAFAIEVIPKTESLPEVNETLVNKSKSEEDKNFEDEVKNRNAIVEITEKCEPMEDLKQSYHARVRDEMHIVSAEISDTEVDNVALLRDVSQNNNTLEQDEPLGDILDEDETNVMRNQDEDVEIIMKTEDCPPDFNAPPIPARNPIKLLQPTSSDSLDKLIPVVDAYSPKTSRLDESFTDESFSLKSFSEIEEHHYFDMTHHPVEEENIYENQAERKILQSQDDVYMNVNEVEYMNAGSVVKTAGDVEYANSDQIVPKNKEEHEYMNSRDLQGIARNRKQATPECNVYENASSIKANKQDKESDNSNQIQRDIEYVNTKKVRSNSNDHYAPKEATEYTNTKNILRVSTKKLVTAKSPSQLNKVEGLPSFQRNVPNRPSIRKSKGSSQRDSSRTNNKASRPIQGPPLPPVPKRNPSTSLTNPRHVEDIEYANSSHPEHIINANKSAVEYSNEPLKRKNSTPSTTPKDSMVKQVHPKDQVEYSNTPLQRKVSNPANVEYSNTPMRRHNSSNDQNITEYSDKTDVEYSNSPMRRKISQTSMKDENKAAKRTKDDVEYSNTHMHRDPTHHAISRSVSVGNDDKKDADDDDEAHIIEYMNAPLRRSVECKDLRIDHPTDAKLPHLSTFPEAQLDISDKSEQPKDQHHKPAKKITPVALKPKKRLSRERHTDHPRCSTEPEVCDSKNDSSETLLTSTIPRILSLEDLCAEANAPGSVLKDETGGNGISGPVEQSSFEETPTTPLDDVRLERTSPLKQATGDKHREDKSQRWRREPRRPIVRTSDRRRYDDSISDTDQPSLVVSEEHQQEEEAGEGISRECKSGQKLSFRPAVPVELKSGSFPAEMGELDSQSVPACGSSSPQAPQYYTLQDTTLQDTQPPTITVHPPQSKQGSKVDIFASEQPSQVDESAAYYPAQPAVYDDQTGAYYDPTTGAYYQDEPNTGAYYPDDPTTYQVYKPSYDGQSFDPSYDMDATANLYNYDADCSTVYAYDDASAYTHPSSVYPDPGQAYYDDQGRVYDPATGLYYEESTGEYFDPAVGFHYDFTACQYYDRDSGFYYDPLSGAFFDAQGTVQGYHQSFYYYEGGQTGTIWNEQTGEYQLAEEGEHGGEEIETGEFNDDIQQRQVVDPNNPNGRVVMRRKSGRRIRKDPPQQMQEDPLNEVEKLQGHNIGHNYLADQPTLEQVALGAVTQIAKNLENDPNESIKKKTKIIGRQNQKIDKSSSKRHIGDAPSADDSRSRPHGGRNANSQASSPAVHRQVYAGQKADPRLHRAPVKEAASPSRHRLHPRYVTDARDHALENYAGAEDESMMSTSYANHSSMSLPKLSLPDKHQSHNLSDSFNHPHNESATLPKRVTIVTDPRDQSKHHDRHSKRRSKRRRRRMQKHNDPKPKNENTTIDFNKYGATAKLWMEQVDRNAVQRSQTMQLTIVPEQDRRPPSRLRSHFADEAIAAHDASMEAETWHDQTANKQHQWVIANGPYLNDNDCLPPGASVPATNSLSSNDPNDPKRSLVFFRVGSNWRQLAWRLFDGCLSEQETLSMIADVERKHPHDVRLQVHDLMSRWWTLKGDQATMAALQKSLDYVRMAYIHEAYTENGKRKRRRSLTDHMGSESELDCSTISEYDPDVSRLDDEYRVRSLNSSRESMTSQSSYGDDKIIKGRGPTERALLSRLANCGLSKHKKRAKKHSQAPYDRCLDQVTADNTAKNRPRPSQLSTSRASLNASRESVGFVSDQGPGRRRNFNIAQPHTTSSEIRLESNI